MVIAGGFAAAEVAKWALPKVRLYSVLVQEQEMELLKKQSASIWKPEMLNDLEDNLQRDLNVICGPAEDEGPRSQTPMSLEEFRKLLL